MAYSLCVIAVASVLFAALVRWVVVDCLHGHEHEFRLGFLIGLAVVGVHLLLESVLRSR